MFSAVTGIEEAALDRNEGVVVIAVVRKGLCQLRFSDSFAGRPDSEERVEGVELDTPLQPAPRVTIDHWYSFWVCDRNVIWLYTDQRSKLLVGIVHS